MRETREGKGTGRKAGRERQEEPELGTLQTFGSLDAYFPTVLSWRLYFIQVLDNVFLRVGK